MKALHNAGLLWFWGEMFNHNGYEDGGIVEKKSQADCRQITDWKWNAVLSNDYSVMADA